MPLISYSKNEILLGFSTMTSLIRSCVLINRSHGAMKSAVPLPIVFLVLIGLLCCFVSATVYAGDYLQDNAKVVSEEMATNLDKELVNIESRDGLHFEVVILPNFYDRQPEAVLNAYIEQLAKNSPNTDKKVLLLIVLENQIAVIRPSSAIASAYNEQVANEIIDNVKKSMKEKNYDEMARVGIAGVYHYYQKQFPSASAQKPATDSWKKMANIGIILAVLVGVILLINSQRKKPPTN